MDLALKRVLFVLKERTARLLFPLAYYGHNPMKTSPVGGGQHRLWDSDTAPRGQCWKVSSDAVHDTTALSCKHLNCTSLFSHHWLSVIFLLGVAKYLNFPSKFAQT